LIKEKRLPFRISDEDFQKLKQISDKLDISISNLIRLIINIQLKKIFGTSIFDVKNTNYILSDKTKYQKFLKIRSSLKDSLKKEKRLVIFVNENIHNFLKNLAEKINSNPSSIVRNIIFLSLEKKDLLQKLKEEKKLEEESFIILSLDEKELEEMKKIAKKHRLKIDDVATRIIKYFLKNKKDLEKVF